MAGSSLLTLLDDIATLLDDVLVMGKLVAKRTVGILDDDLSLSAQQVTGVRASRELPVVWGVAKGLFINKMILVPLVLLTGAFTPWAITPSLMLEGAFLCFEGIEKILYSLEACKHKEDLAQRQQRLQALAECDPLVFERDKMKGAIRTGFILSAEIVAITPGTVTEAPLPNQILTPSGITILVTIGVCSLVGMIVRLDGMGYWLAEKCTVLAQWLGEGLLVVTPWLVKVLSIVGALAMFLVDGGIAVRGIAPLHHVIEHWSAGLGEILAPLLPVIASLVLGFIISAVVLASAKVVSSLRRPVKQGGCTQRGGTASSTLKTRPASTPAGALMSPGLRNVLRDNDG